MAVSFAGTPRVRALHQALLLGGRWVASWGVMTETRVWHLQVLQLEAQLSSLSKSPLPRRAASIVDKARLALNAGQ